MDCVRRGTDGQLILRVRLPHHNRDRSAAGDNLNDAFYLADEVHAGCESTCYFI